MPRHNSTSASPTGPQAEYILARLVKERRVSAREIGKYLSEMLGEIDALEQRLLFLRQATGNASSAPRRGRGPGRRAAASDAPVAADTTARGTPRRRRRQQLTPARRAALKKQGHYLALMRSIPKTARAKFKALFKNKGVDTALKAMRKAVGR